jgi:hypothetical protein
VRGAADEEEFGPSLSLSLLRAGPFQAHLEAAIFGEMRPSTASAPRLAWRGRQRVRTFGNREKRRPSRGGRPPPREGAGGPEGGVEAVSPSRGPRARRPPRPADPSHQEHRDVPPSDGRGMRVAVLGAVLKTKSSAVFVEAPGRVAPRPASPLERPFASSDGRVGRAAASVRRAARRTPSSP